MRTASIQATLANCNRDASKRPEPFTIYDFLPASMDRREAPKEPTQQEMEQGMRELNALLGGVDLTKQNG